MIPPSPAESRLRDTLQVIRSERTVVVVHSPTPTADDSRALAAVAVLSGLPHVLDWPAGAAGRWRTLLNATLDGGTRLDAVAEARRHTTDDRTLLLRSAALMLVVVLSAVPRRERRDWLRLIGDPQAFLGPTGAVVRARRRPGLMPAPLAALVALASLAGLMSLAAAALR